MEKYIEQDKLIYDTINSGIRLITSQQTLGIMTPEIASDIPFASARIDPDIFISMLRPRSEEGCHGKFRKMIKNFNDSERSLLLKFITGAGRLM